MTPSNLGGAWRRRSLSIDGSEPCEPADVWWLQVGNDFIDVRLPHDRQGDSGPALLSGPGAFAGRTSWTDPVLTWHHQLDSAHLDSGHLDSAHLVGTADVGPDAGPDAETSQDRGVLSWDGPLLVESGSALLDGVEVPYVEVWEQVAESGPTTTSGFTRSADGSGCVAQIGDQRLALTIDRSGQRWAAIHHQRVDGAWLSTIRIGHDPLLATLDLPTIPQPDNETEET